MSKSIQVNAWLERTDPIVEITDQENEIRLVLKGCVLDELLANSNLSTDELYSDKSFTNEIIDELFSHEMQDMLGFDVGPGEEGENVERSNTNNKCSIIEFPVNNQLIHGRKKKAL